MTAARHIEFAYADAFDPARFGADPKWLAALRGDAIGRVRERGLPGPRIEAWKYTNLNALAKAGHTPANATEAPALDGALLPADAPGCRLVFVNGIFRADLSTMDDLPKGVAVLPLSAALTSHRELIEANLGGAAGPLVDLNMAFMGDGALIHLPKGVVLEDPVHLVFAGAAGDQPVAFHPRVLVVLEDESQADLIESHIGSGPYWTNPVVDIALGAGARLGHYKLQADAPAAAHLAVARLRLQARASYEGMVLATGATPARNEIALILAGENAEARLLGAYMVGGKAHMDNTTLIEHAAAGCTSREFYKGVLDDRARGVFQGKVVVKKGAQKTDSHMLNKTLLLSDKAEIDSKPELEIYADDVKCGHGATVGEIEDDALFYLRARGIGKTEARALLVEAFLMEVIAEVSLAPVREALAARVTGWLAAHGKGSRA